MSNNKKEHWQAFTPQSEEYSLFDITAMQYKRNKR
jgi:hypothetical protein